MAGRFKENFDNEASVEVDVSWLKKKCAEANQRIAGISSRSGFVFRLAGDSETGYAILMTGADGEDYQAVKTALEDLGTCTLNLMLNGLLSYYPNTKK